MKKPGGFTLIELIVFIVVSGIIAHLVSICYSTILKGAPVTINQTTATQVAATCLEWYVGQRHVDGFSANSLVTGTTTPTFCSTMAPAGYSLSTNVSNTTLYGDTQANYKIITVTVKGPNAVAATLSTMIASY